MYYIRIDEDNNFGFVFGGIHNILTTDIKISNEDYNKFFELQSEGKQFRVNNSDASELFEILEEYTPVVENPPSSLSIYDRVLELEEHNVNIVATNWDMDFRLCEVEWLIEDAGIGTNSFTKNIKINLKGETNMALSRYEQAKIMIVGGVYNKETLTRQLTTYLKRGYVTQEEYDELIALMEARELVTDK